MASWRQRIADLWQSIRLLIGVLSLVRFHLIVVAVALVLVLEVDQIRDVILGYGLAFRSGPGWPAVWLLVTMFGCALVLWYSARVMLRFRFDTPAVEVDEGLRCAPSDEAVWPRVKTLLPRILGGSVFVIFLIGLASLDRAYAFEPLPLALAVTGLLALFMLLVIFRRKWLGIDDTADNGLTEFAALPTVTRRLYYVLLAANVVVTVTAVAAPHEFARALGPGAVLLLAASLIVVIGSTLVYWSNWFRFPVVIATLAVIAFFSLFNENHLARRCPDMRSTDAAFACPQVAPPTQDVAAALDAWVAARKDEGPLLPLFIVATEGGGIRAAYWTAAVLARLDDLSPEGARFGRHVFAISGVSGGSLGAAAFAALLREGGRDLLTRSEALLAEDFLGPTLTTLMFADLLQRLLPAPVFDDRAMTLEQAWERAWRAHEPGDRFAAPFESLWRRDGEVPLLFLNSTVVETGARLIQAPVRLRDGEREAFVGALDGGDVFGRGAPLSTVVHNTARFPYISPAGLLRRADTPREHWLRLVDGGYFDNSGALTATELLAIVQRHRGALAQRHGVRVMPYVLHITNGGVDRVGPCRDAVADAPSDARGCPRRRLLPESLSPLWGVLNVRAAHTRRAAKVLEAAGAGVGYKALALRNNGVVHPLGWLLAEPSRRDMRCQVTGYDDPACAAPAQDDLPSARADLAEIIAFLRSAKGHTF